MEGTSAQCCWILPFKLRVHENNQQNLISTLTLYAAFTVLEQRGVHVFKLGFLILEVYQVKHDKQKIEQLGEERS